MKARHLGHISFRVYLVCIFGVVGQHSPDVLKWNKVLVNKGLVDFAQDIHTFCHFSKHSMDSIQVIKVLTSCNKELKIQIKADFFHHVIHCTSKTNMVCSF